MGLDNIFDPGKSVTETKIKDVCLGDSRGTLQRALGSSSPSAISNIAKTLGTRFMEIYLTGNFYSHLIGVFCKALFPQLN